MIRIFFTEDGYYVAGESIEVTRSCSPALTARGDRIFQPLHHEYKVLYLALSEIREANISDDIIVYGTSRIIDELNGNVRPLDSTNERWLSVLKRDVIPFIKAVIFFRKKELKAVQQTLADAHGQMLAQLDRRTLETIAAHEIERNQSLESNKKQQLIQKLRDSWFGDNTDGK